MGLFGKSKDQKVAASHSRVPDHHASTEPPRRLDAYLYGRSTYGHSTHSHRTHRHSKPVTKPGPPTIESRSIVSISIRSTATTVSVARVKLQRLLSRHPPRPRRPPSHTRLPLPCCRNPSRKRSRSRPTARKRKKPGWCSWCRRSLLTLARQLQPLPLTATLAKTKPLPTPSTRLRLYA